MYKGIKLSCSLNSSLNLKTEHDATFFSHTSAKPSRSHARTSGHIARSRPLPNRIVRTGQSPDVGDFRLPKTWSLAATKIPITVRGLQRL